MPSRMATIPVTTISSVSVKPVCRFMGRQCTGGGAWTNRQCVTRAGPIRRTACGGLWAVAPGLHNAPKRAQGATIEPSDRSHGDGLQGLDQSIHGVEGGVQVRGHADAAATDAHVNASLGERTGEILPQAALRAQPDHVTGALRVSGGRESPRLRSRNELIRPRSQLSVVVLWRQFCD